MLTLPVGTRLEVIENSDLLLDIGTRLTLRERYDGSGMLWVLVDGERMTSTVHKGEVKIIIDGKGIVLAKKHAKIEEEKHNG